MTRPSLDGPGLGPQSDDPGGNAPEGAGPGLPLGDDRSDDELGDELGGDTVAMNRTIALVGLMGAGKTTIGRRLARALGVPFKDADEEIERAAGLSVQEIFDRHGECEFRRGERRVIGRLLEEPPHVLATGGGAFIQGDTRALMRTKALTIWLRADFETLMRRVSRRDHRPLLKEDDPGLVMQRLMAARYPIYAQADIVVDTTNGPHGSAVRAVLTAVRAWMAAHPVEGAEPA